MFDRRKAYIIYNELLDDLIESKKKLQDSNNYDYYIDSGIVIVSKKYSTEKVISYLKKFASNDNYNLTICDVSNSNTGKNLVLFSIDNEPKDLKVKRIGENNKLVIRK